MQTEIDKFDLTDRFISESGLQDSVKVYQFRYMLIFNKFSPASMSKNSRKNFFHGKIFFFSFLLIFRLYISEESQKFKSFDLHIFFFISKTINLFSFCFILFYVFFLLLFPSLLSRLHWVMNNSRQRSGASPNLV